MNCVVIRNAELPLGSHIFAVDYTDIDRGSTWGAGLFSRQGIRQYLVTDRGIIVGVYPDDRTNRDTYIMALKHFAKLNKKYEKPA